MVRKLTDKQRHERHKARNWGGARRGAGRKPSGRVPKLPICLYVDEGTKRIYTELKGRGCNPSFQIEMFIVQLAAQMGVH